MRYIMIALLVMSSPVSGQETRPIERGRSIPGTLESGSQHDYTLELGPNMFVYGAVDQVSVDVALTVLGPDGQQIGSFDSPSRGLEYFRFETESEGTFVIRVTPSEEDGGDYAIEILRSERVATDPEDRVDQMMIPFTGDDGPGAVVGVVIDGKLHFARAYGMANLEHGIPFDVGTLSNIGSVTKQFTAMGLLLLQARGKLSMEDDIRKHIPELPDFGDPITIKNLLNHTGGYREVYNLLPMTGYVGEDALSRQEVIQLVQRQSERQAPPNTEFNYNNTGYILLAETVERVSGMTFPEYMKANVFEPLGMRNTRVKGYQGELIPGSAQGYLSTDNGVFRSTRDLAASAGAGGIYTTLEDLTKWMLNYRDGTLGGPEAIEALTSPAILENDESTSYGLGLGVREFAGQRIYAHTGGDIAHRTYFGYFPDLDAGVIMMSNNAAFDLSMGTRIARLFLSEHFEDEAASTSSSDVSVSVQRLDQIAGDWIIDAIGTSTSIAFSVEDGALFAELPGQGKLLATPTSDSTFSMTGPDVRVTFHFERDGTVERATLHRRNTEMPVRRSRKVELTDEDLAAYAGQYFSEELLTFYEVRVEEGRLVVDHLRLEPIPLNHLEVDQFTGSAFFLSTVTFKRAGNGRITGFMVSNGRTKSVWFRNQHAGSPP